MFFKKRKLFASIKKKDTEMVQRLIAEDPNLVNARDRNGNTPLHWATGWRLQDMTRFLLEAGADVNAKAKWGGTPLHGVASNGDGWEDMAQLLIDHGADINAPDKEGRTPLDSAKERPTIACTFKTESFLQERGARTSR